MTTMTRTRLARTLPASGLRPWMLACLLVALVLAPWLGSIHAVLHVHAAPAGKVVGARSSPAMVATAATTARAAPAHDGTPACGGLLRLFGGHTHDNDCRLFDQLSHADAPGFAHALPPVALPPVALLAWHAGECLRRWAALFDARGPPFLA